MVLDVVSAGTGGPDFRLVGETEADQIEIDVGWRSGAPARGRPSDRSASIDAWPAHGLMGGRLGPNANGAKW